MLAAQLGRIQFFEGPPRRSGRGDRVSRSTSRKSLWLPETISEAMNTQGLIAGVLDGRPEESLALIRAEPRGRARERRCRVPRSAPTSTSPTRCSSATASTTPIRWTWRRLPSAAGSGGAVSSGSSRCTSSAHRWLMGEWDELFAMMRRRSERRGGAGRSRAGIEGIAIAAILAAGNRGLIDDVESVLRRLGATTTTPPTSRSRGSYLVVCAIVANATGDHADGPRIDSRAAFDLAETLSATALRRSSSHTSRGWRPRWRSGDRAATWMDSSRRSRGGSPGSVTPLMRAMTDRFRARLDPSVC